MLKEGDTAPAFRLLADDGSEMSLAELRGKHVALYFYPKASTPGCTTEAIEFRDVKEEFDKLNAIILGCSADSVEAQAKFKIKQKLNFPLLSDPDFTVIEPYGARRMKSFHWENRIWELCYSTIPDPALMARWRKFGPLLNRRATPPK